MHGHSSSLDATVNTDGRYLALGRAPLYGRSGLLLLSGLILSGWRLPSRVLPLSLGLVPLLGSQVVSPRVPALADAMVALPGHCTCWSPRRSTRLVAVLPFPSVARAVLLVAVPAYAMVFELGRLHGLDRQCGRRPGTTAGP